MQDVNYGNLTVWWTECFLLCICRDQSQKKWNPYIAIVDIQPLNQRINWVTLIQTNVCAPIFTIT